MAEAKADTVPGLGFKDKEKALDTIKNLEGRDPDYQKLAIKGLIGRAKRTLTLTKDKEKLQNINEAMAVFDEWLSNYEKNGLAKENRPYLPLNAITALLPLKKQLKLEDSKAEAFYKAYKEKAKGDYKNLRTVSSGEDEQSWDIVRNSALKKLLEDIDDKKTDLWKDDLPTKDHLKLILWAYSPEASKVKKNVSNFEEKLGSGEKDSSDESEEEKGSKRKSKGNGGSSDESSSKKKKSKK